MNIAILGEGLTGKAVTAYCTQHNYRMVPPQDADVIVASPGIPPENYPKVSAPIISEIEFAYREAKTRGPLPTLIGVTGTNGKSTVTAMISHLLDCPAAGNIGRPFVSLVDGLDQHKAIVLELSSYQLERCITLHCNIAVVLNITPDHLKRHKTMENYRSEKLKITQNQTEQDVVIYNADDTYLNAGLSAITSPKMPFSTHLDPKDALKKAAPDGKHNHVNAHVANLVCQRLGMDKDTIINRLASFTPLPHRLEPVPNKKQRRIYNDSKATNPDATLAAVQAFDERSHLILGGEDKGLNVKAFAREITKNSKSIALFGEIKERLFQTLKESKPAQAIQPFDTLQEAVKWTMAQTKVNDIILFSPACASFDQFANFEERGQAFKTCVHNL